MVRNDVYFPTRCLCSEKFLSLITNNPELVSLDYSNGQIFATYDDWARELIAEFVLPISLRIVGFKLDPYYGTIEIFADTITNLRDDEKISSEISNN